MSGSTRLALRDAMGLPALVLAASFLGFGALVRETGLDLWFGLFTTAVVWALPGQVAMVELLGVGASLLAVAGAVWLTNARLMPMVILLLPLLRQGRADSRWARRLDYALAHVIAVTSWAVALRRLPDLPREQRRRYFMVLGGTLWLASLVGTAVGYLLAGAMPREVALGLVFLNPVYFLLLFVVDLRRRMQGLALGLGAAMGPALHHVTPDWGLLLTGVLAGTLAFALDRFLPGRRRHA